MPSFNSLTIFLFLFSIQVVVTDQVVEVSYMLCYSLCLSLSYMRCVLTTLVSSSQVDMEEEEDIGDQMREEDDQIIDTMEEGVTQMEEGDTIATIQISKGTEAMNGRC